MRIIFCDIDGVLVNRWSLSQRSGTLSPFAPECVSELNRIIRVSQAKIVVTSVWRRGLKLPRTEMSELFSKCGVEGTVIGVTPFISGKDRGDEIRTWIDDYEDRLNSVDSFVILDDDSDMGLLRSHLVLANSRVGLTATDADHAISILNGGKL